MNIEKIKALFICSDDPDYGEPMEETTFVINSALTLSIYEDRDYVFREITGWGSDKQPIIDLAVAKRFELIMQPAPEEVDVKWLLGASVLGMAQQFLK